MKENVYVIGHNNPDTDSICSVITYAYLKSKINSHFDFKPGRIGPLNMETEFVLKHFGIEAPEMIDNVWTKVRDILPEKTITIRGGASLKEAGRLMKKNNIRSLPVVDEKNRPLGIITEGDLASRYLEELGEQSLKENPLPLELIAETIEAEVLLKNKKVLSGRVIVGAMKPDSMSKYLKAGDIVIIGDRTNAQLKALESEISCLVITGGNLPEKEVIQSADEKRTSILLTSIDSYSAARGINLAIPANQIMQGKFISFSVDDLVRDIVDDIVACSARAGLALDSNGQLAGILTRTNLINIPREKVILVDHKELNQTVPGIEEAEILEIIDHHRLGDIQTRNPISIINLPFGSTATIISQEFTRQKVKIPENLAGCLMAAILSDTVLLKSPTATDEDKQELSKLSSITGLDPMKFGAQMYEMGRQIVNLSPMELINYDLKTFIIKDLKVGIGQIETTETEILLKKKTEILKEMEKAVKARGYDALLIMVTDIMLEATELLAIGQTKFVEKAFMQRFKDNSIHLPGVISRKKQIIAKLL